MVAWTNFGYTPAGSDVRLRLFDASGTATSGEIVVPASGTAGQATPRVTTLGSLFAVAWADSPDAQGNAAIHVQAYQSQARSTARR